MIIFLGSWAMMFAALFFAYALVRLRAPAWPPPDQPALPVLVPGLNTVVIAASSAAVVLAVRAHALGRHRRASIGLGVAACLGALFLGLQILVWVGVGLAALGVLAIHARPSRGTTRSAVRLWGMFWHFVGAVWLALYVAVYLV